MIPTQRKEGQRREGRRDRSKQRTNVRAKETTVRKDDEQLAKKKEISVSR